MSAAAEHTPSNQPQAEVKGGMVPYLMVDGASKAAAFYERAFGAQEVFRYPEDEQGRTMHIHVYVNGSSLMLSDPFPEHGAVAEKAQGYSLQLILKADEIDAWWKRAVEAGCEVVMPLEVMFWGDRWGQLRDPFGVTWGLDAPAK